MHAQTLRSSSAAILKICGSRFHLGIPAFVLRQQIKIPQRNSNVAVATGMVISRTVLMEPLLFSKVERKKKKKNDK